MKHLGCIYFFLEITYKGKIPSCFPCSPNYFVCLKIHSTINRLQIKLHPRGWAVNLYKSLWSDVGETAWLTVCQKEETDQIWRRLWQSQLRPAPCWWMVHRKDCTVQSQVNLGSNLSSNHWPGMPPSGGFFKPLCISFFNYKMEIIKPVWAEAISLMVKKTIYCHKFLTFKILIWLEIKRIAHPHLQAMCLLHVGPIIRLKLLYHWPLMPSSWWHPRTAWQVISEVRRLALFLVSSLAFSDSF